MSNNTPLEARPLADMLVLQQRLRSCKSITDIGYLLANHTRSLSDYRSAIFWSLNNHPNGHLQSISGISQPNETAPFYQWAKSVCRHFSQEYDEQRTEVNASNLPTELQDEWSDFLPHQGLWLPLKTAHGEIYGYLLLAREEKWLEDEQRMLDLWTGAAAHAIRALNAPVMQRGSLFTLTHKIILAITIAFVAALFIPIPLTVLANAEVVPEKPLIVRAPIDGVIDNVSVRPNQSVNAGTPLLNLDDTALQARIKVAEQDLQIAQAEYRIAEQSSVRSRESTAELPLIASRIEQRQAEVDYVESLLERIEINAQQDGIVIMQDPSELEGKPVQLGERLLTLADPKSAEIELWLPMADSIPLQENAPIKIFFHVAPDHDIEATLRYLNYRSEVSSDGILAFRGRAVITSNNGLTPRIGWRGNAKLYGENVPLYYYLFRRPFFSLRQMLSL